MAEVKASILTQVDWFILAFLAHSPGSTGSPGKEASAPGCSDFHVGTRLYAPWSPWRGMRGYERRGSLQKLIGHGYLEPVTGGGGFRATANGLAALTARPDRLFVYYVEYGTRKRPVPAVAYAYLPESKAGKSYKLCPWAVRPIGGPPAEEAPYY